MSNLPPKGLSHEEREQWFADRVPKPGKRPERIIEKVVYVKVKDTKAEQQLADTLKGMEAAAARAAQPGANVPPAIAALMDKNLTHDQNVEKLRQRWAALTNQQMAEAQKSNALPPMTDAERAELKTLNTWDKLRGG